MKTLSLLFTLVAVLFFAIGCDQPTTNDPGATETHDQDHGHDDHESHDHAEHDHAAPHGGHLIELGHNREYHAELVDDHETEMVTVYLMDSHMAPLKLDEPSILLVLTAGNRTESFEMLASQPDASTDFSSTDERLMEMIEGEQTTGKLRVTINGKPYSGTFDHHGHRHDARGDSHAGHDH